MIIYVIFGVILAAMICSLFQFLHVRWSRVAVSSLLVLAWVMILTTLVVRGIVGKHWPLGTRFEFTLCFAWIMLSLYLLLERLAHTRDIGIPMTIILAGTVGSAVTLPTQAMAVVPLPAVLNSAWLQIHVLTLMISYGFYGVAAAASLTALIFKPVKGDNNPGNDSMPDGYTILRQLTLRLLAGGFPWLTGGILVGAVWAHLAWGRYWGWDIKETWALITWLWFGLIFHVLPPVKRHGNRLFWMVLVGFALIMFTFTGVAYLSEVLSLDTLHGY